MDLILWTEQTTETKAFWSIGQIWDIVVTNIFFTFNSLPIFRIKWQLQILTCKCPISVTQIVECANTHFMNVNMRFFLYKKAKKNYFHDASFNYSSIRCVRCFFWVFASKFQLKTLISYMYHGTKFSFVAEKRTMSMKHRYDTVSICLQYFETMFSWNSILHKCRRFSLLLESIEIQR